MTALYTLDQLKNCLTPVFRKNHVRSAVLFGSYAKGSATENSDIDLMVDSGLHGLSFFGLLDDVCRALQCDVDLIDQADIHPGSLVDREIRQIGVLIYEQ